MIDNQVIAFLVDVFRWAYGIAGFIILAQIPLDILFRALKGKERFI